MVCLHNPDVDADGAAIRRLAGMLTIGDGAVAPALRTGGIVRREGFHYPSVAREAFVALRAVAAPGVPSGVPASSGRPAPGRTARRFGSGALLVLDRRVYAAVHGFDERYFLYGEDLDLWHRLQAAGYRNRFAVDEVVEHAGKSGSDMAIPRRELLRWLGVELFAECHTHLGWRPYRSVHRALLGYLTDLTDLGELGDRVRAAWAAGARPSSVQAVVRESLFGAPAGAHRVAAVGGSLGSVSPRDDSDPAARTP